MSDNNQSLSFEEVTKRFADSEQALRQAQEHLHGLIEAEGSTAASARSLRESAEAVKALAQSAGTAVEDLASAQADVQRALEAGAEFLNGRQLSELIEAVARLDRRLEPLEARMLAAEEARDAAQAAHEEIHAVKEAFPWPWKRRLRNR